MLRIGMVLINAVLGVAALFKKLHRYRAKLGIAQHIFRLLRPLGDVLYFNPPLNIERQTLDKAVQLCTEAIKEILD